MHNESTESDAPRAPRMRTSMRTKHLTHSSAAPRPRVRRPEHRARSGPRHKGMTGCEDVRVSEVTNAVEREHVGIAPV